MTHDELIQELLDSGVLETPRILGAFQAINRVNFVPESAKANAYVNAPLSIGHGQTISQPFTVAFMLELLQPQLGDNILDLGSGSGWQSALLAHIVGASGHITAIEIVLELYAQSLKSIGTYNFLKQGIVEIHNISGQAGYPKNAPYDGIIAAAALPGEIPQAWKSQLKINGRLITPVGGSIVKLEKNPDGSFSEQEYSGFAFVPFIESPS